MAHELVRRDVMKSDLLQEEIHTALIDDLAVFVMPKPGFRRKYAEFFVHYGSNDNTFIWKGKRLDVPPGIAHFLEHKMFEKKGRDMFSEFSRVGASANAYTSNNYTSYLFWTLSGWEEALADLAEVVFDPYFTPESVRKEQGIIGQEIRMYNDEPASRLMRETLQLLYEKHPVRLDIAGTEESIKRIDENLLYRCHGAFYRPDNMSLFIAGDLDPENVFEVVRKVIPSREEGVEKPPSRIRPDEPPDVGEGTEIYMPVPVPLIQIAWKIRPMQGDGAAMIRNELSLSMLLDILFGKSSAFFMKAYEDGLLDDISASFESWPDYAFALLGAQTVKPQELAERVQKEVDEARRRGIGPADFNRTLKGSFGRYVTLFDSFDVAAEVQAHLHDIGEDIFSYGGILRGLTLDDVNDSLKMLDSDKCVKVVVRDKASER